MATTQRVQPAADKRNIVARSWDPVTRIIGNLGIYTKIDFDAREVVECKSTSSLFRGYSVFMKGKDPRDAALGDDELEISAQELRPGVQHLTIGFANTSPSVSHERSDALRRTFLSAHLVVHAADGQLVSQTDPPAALRDAAQACHNDGLWPVLVGEPGARDTVLGSPIILSDHPAVAPESPGDLFDGGEIDALLIHSIRALSDAEREEMRATDPRVREILDRSLALSPEQMLDLHGAVRELRPLEGP